MIAQLPESADHYFLQAISQEISEAHPSCLKGVKLAVRVSAFDLTFAYPPRYPIARRDRGERISRTSFDPLVRSDSFVFFTQMESPIDAIPFSADGAFIRVFDSKIIQHPTSDCVLVSASSDRSSAFADISLYKITTAVEAEDQIELTLDEAKVDGAAAGLVECVRELLTFANGGK